MKHAVGAAFAAALIVAGPALAAPDSLKSRVDQNQAGSTEKKPFEFYLTGSYTGSGTDEVRRLSDLDERSSTLEAGFDHSVYWTQNVLKLNYGAFGSYSDDRLAADDDSSKVGAKMKLSLLPKGMFSPFGKIAWEKKFGDFYDGAKDSKWVYTGGLDANFVLRPKGEDAAGKVVVSEIALKPTVSYALTDSTNRDRDNRTIKLEATLEGLSYNGVSVELYGNVSDSRSRHDITGKTFRLKEDAAEAGATFGFSDFLTKRVPEDVARSNWFKILKELKVEVKWVDQDSNSGTATDSYSRWQIVPAFKLTYPWGGFEKKAATGPGAG